MANQTVGRLNVFIGGDANPLVAELKRADAEARSRSASIGGQMNKLSRDLKKSFSAAKFGKDVLTGLGIGSGFAVAEFIAEAVTKYYREQADLAKSIEESTARQLALTRQIIALRHTPEQKRMSLEKEYADLERQLKEASTQRFRPNVGGGFGLEGAGMMETALVPRERTQKEQDEVNKLEEALKSLGLELDKLRLDEKTAKASTALREFFSDLDEMASSMPTLEQVSDDRRKRFNKAFNEAYHGGLKNPFGDSDFKRWEQAAGSLRVDDMTRRGLGSGANYKDVMSQTNSILTEILKAIRARPTGTYAVYGN